MSVQSNCIIFDLITAIAFICLLFIILIESCTLNYCQDGILVYFGTETQQYGVSIYGHYELQPGEVNGRPYFKMGSMGLWWDGIEDWWIGFDSKKGQSIGYAYYTKDVFCPHQLTEWNWVLYYGTDWKTAGKDLGISCKYIFVKHNQIGPTAPLTLMATTKLGRPTQ